MNAAPPVRMLRPLAELDYGDSQSIILPVTITPLQAWNYMTAEPRPLLRWAFGVRDAVSTLFGVKRIGGFSGARRESVKAGDQLDFFQVEHSTGDMLVLTERDRHLDVMICIATAGRLLTVTASVVTHNTFGRLYMLPVGPVHRWIVRDDLKRLKQRLEESASQVAGG